MVEDIDFLEIGEKVTYKYMGISDFTLIISFSGYSTCRLNYALEYGKYWLLWRSALGSIEVKSDANDKCRGELENYMHKGVFRFREY